MSDYSELKRLAEAALNDNGDYMALNDYGMAVPPAVVLDLIAEVEGLRAQHGRDSAELRSLCQARDYARKERDQLKAENAGLKTGYEAYEQVNAELKAEVEGLRKLGPSKEIIWCAWGDGHAANSYGAGFMDANEGVCANCDAANQRVEPDLDTLRKDAERYRWLRRAGNTKAIALVAEHCLDALDETIDAALGLGEQS